MRPYRVIAKGTEVGTYLPTRAYDPPGALIVFGRFTPGEAYAPFAHLFACTDERFGSDWDDSAQANLQRAQLGLELRSGDPIRGEDIMIHDFGPAIGRELTVRLGSLQDVERFLGKTDLSPDPPAPDIPGKIDRAREALKVFLSPGHRRDDVNAAIRIWKRLASRQPGWMEPYTALTELYVEIGLIPEAKASLQAVVDACLKGPDPAAAEAPLRRIVGLDPTDVRSRAALADLCERLGKRADAVEQHLAIANLLWEMGHRPEAVRVIETGLRRLGKDAALRSRLDAFRRGIQGQV